MKARIQWAGEAMFLGESGSGHVVVMDGPPESGGRNLGVRPMFGENIPNFEVHIFDFRADLYGQHLSVALVEYLRPEMKFDSIGGLVEQMDRDSARARDILATR